jgi:hypothetical protein
VTTIPTAQKPRGVVFAFHGCLQYVTEFGFKSASCPNCHGAQPAGVCRSAPYPCIVPGLVHAALVQRPRRRSPWPRASLTALILSQAPRAVRCWSMPRGRAAIARRPAAGTPEMMTLVWKFVKSGYAVVAMSARRGGDQWRCYETRWPPEEWQELPGVRAPAAAPARLHRAGRPASATGRFGAACRARAAGERLTVRARPAPAPELVSARAPSRVCVLRAALLAAGRSMPGPRGARSACALPAPWLGEPARLRAHGQRPQHVQRRGHARSPGQRTQHVRRRGRAAARRSSASSATSCARSAGGTCRGTRSGRRPVASSRWSCRCASPSRRALTLYPLPYPTAGHRARAGRRRRRAARSRSACLRPAAP